METILTVPLRRVLVKTNRSYKTERAVNEIRRFVKKHLKPEEVRISTLVNEELWAYSRQQPPGKLKVKVEVKDGIARVRLPEEMAPVPPEKGKLDKLKEKVAGVVPGEKTAEKKAEEKKTVADEGKKAAATGKTEGAEKAVAGKEQKAATVEKAGKQ